MTTHGAIANEWAMRGVIPVQEQLGREVREVGRSTSSGQRARRWRASPATKGPAARRKIGWAGPLVLADLVRGEICRIYTSTPSRSEQSI